MTRIHIVFLIIMLINVIFMCLSLLYVLPNYREDNSDNRAYVIAFGPCVQIYRNLVTSVFMRVVFSLKRVQI